MTLIEVIVAMAILAVVVTPTLRIFATSSSTNLRAKYRQRATTVGESVMESFKAYTMQTLCTQFSTAGFTGVNGASSMNVMAYYPNPADAANPLVKSPFHVNGVLNQDAQQYRFRVQGAKSEGSKYDIEITATPHKQSVIRFEDHNAYSDAIIDLQESVVYKSETTGNVTYATDVLNGIKDKAKTDYINAGHSTGYTVDTSSSTISDLKRKIAIKVTDTGSTQTVTYSLIYNAKVTLSCKYTSPTGVETTISPSPVYEVEYKVVLNDAATGDDQYVKEVYNNVDTLSGATVNERICKLDNVYLYYFPINKTLYGENCEDIISFEASNLSGTLYGGSTEEDREAGKAPLNLIIARQMPTALNATQLADSDSVYVFKVEGSLPASGGGKVNLYHNFCEKFSEDYTSAYESIEAANAKITGGFNSCKDIKTDFIQNINLIYDLDVKIYEDSTDAFDESNLLAEFIGTKNE